jgi:phage terminase large subunit-like protein
MASRTPLDPAVKAARGTIERARERRRATSATVRQALAGRAPVVPRRPYAAIAEQYAADVIGGRVVAGRLVKLACERHIRDRHRATADPSWPYRWDPTQAARACRFIERLPHVEGSWATNTIRLEPFQTFIVSSLFGWRKRVGGGRRFTEGYLEVARKSAKTTLSAAIGLYHLAEEREPGAQLRYAATTGQQARIVFAIAARMVECSPWLRSLGFRTFANSITFEPKGVPQGNAQPINAKASTQDGLNPSCVILDEGHALPDHRLRNVLKSAMGGRENPLTWLPTTAGYNVLGPAHEARGFLIKVLDSIYEADHLFGMVFTLDEGDDWRDETVWPKAAPMLGITPKLDWMRQYCAEAQAAPGLEGEFRTKCCNVWLQSSSAWLSVAAWDACADATLSLDDFEGEPCVLGADLAQLDDIAALAFLFQRDDLLHVFVKCYLPRDVVEARAKAVPAYRTWVEQGVLTITDGAMIDYNVIEADIRAACKRFRVRAIRLDQYGSAQMASALATDGLPAAILDKNAKTFTPAARDFETRIRHGRLRHDGNPILRWMVSNAVVRRGVNDTLLPQKENPMSPNKIDAVDAICEALSAQLVLPPERAHRRVRARVWTEDGFKEIA